MFGDVVYQAGGFCGPRVQPDWQLVVLDQGHANLQIDGFEHHLPANHVALMKPSHLEYYHFSESQPTRHRWAAIDPSLVSGALLADCLTAPLCLPLSSQLHSLIELGLSMPMVASLQAKHHLEQLGVLAISQFMLEVGHAALYSGLPSCVLRAQQMLEAELGRQLSIAEVARACFVSQQHLIRVFKQHLGITPARYLWKIRVRKAVELLANTGLSVFEISLRCGFQTSFHFARVIKQHYAKSPTQLRHDL